MNPVESAIREQEQAINNCANLLTDASQTLSDALDLIRSAARRSPQWAQNNLDNAWFESAKEILDDMRCALDRRRNANNNLVRVAVETNRLPPILSDQSARTSDRKEEV